MGLIDYEKLIELQKNLSFEDQLSLNQEWRRLKFQNSFGLFAKEMCGFKDMNPRTHGPMVRAFESKSRRKLIVVPRDCFKSSIGLQAFALWRLVKNPNIRIMLDGETLENTKTHLVAIKAFMKSERFIELYGEFEHKDRLWGAEKITVAQRTNTTLKEPSIFCSGIGVSKTGQHVDLIIGDDYNTDKNSDTPEKCEKITAHVKYNLSILDSMHGEYVFIGTRYSENDVYGWILRDLLGLKYLSEGEFKDDELAPYLKAVPRPGLS